MSKKKRPIDWVKMNEPFERLGDVISNKDTPIKLKSKREKKPLPFKNLSHCPFCKGEASIQVTTDEGNFKDDDYIDNPYSGLSFAIIHDNESNPSCPVAHHVGEFLGSKLYKSKLEAITAWNTARRKKNLDKSDPVLTLSIRKDR